MGHSETATALEPQNLEASPVPGGQSVAKPPDGHFGGMRMPPSTRMVSAFM